MNSASLRLVLLGAGGRLGTQISQQAVAAGVTVLPCGRAELANASAFAALFEQPCVVLDVSQPQGTLRLGELIRNLPEASLRHVRGIVCGVTGHDSRDIAAIREALSARVAWTLVPNFSAGVYLFQQLLTARTAGGKTVAELARSLGFELGLWEAHHAKKKDAPSGTALHLAAAAGVAAEGIAATRTGWIVGEHTLLVSAPAEELRICHIAHERSLFARGALTLCANLAAAHLAPGEYAASKFFE